MACCRGGGNSPLFTFCRLVRPPSFRCPCCWRHWRWSPCMPCCCWACLAGRVRQKNRQPAKRWWSASIRARSPPNPRPSHRHRPGNPMSLRRRRPSWRLRCACAVHPPHRRPGANRKRKARPARHLRLRPLLPRRIRHRPLLLPMQRRPALQARRSPAPRSTTPRLPARPPAPPQRPLRPRFPSLQSWWPCLAHRPRHRRPSCSNTR